MKDGIKKSNIIKIEALLRSILTMIQHGIGDVLIQD